MKSPISEQTYNDARISTASRAEKGTFYNTSPDALSREDWFRLHTWYERDLPSIEELVEKKAAHAWKISVIFPTYNEQENIGQNIRLIQEHFIGQSNR